MQHSPRIPAPPRDRRRRYLTAAERRGEIIEAAIAEFSARGYTETTMAGIARRAGLSRSGLYAHYRGKQAIFEAALTQVLIPPESADSRWWQTGTTASAATLLRRYVDLLYAHLGTAQGATLLRLAIGTGHAVPSLLQAWYARVMHQYLRREQAAVDALVRRGVFRR